MGSFLKKGTQRTDFLKVTEELNKVPEISIYKNTSLTLFYPSNFYPLLNRQHAALAE